MRSRVKIKERLSQRGRTALRDALWAMWCQATGGALGALVLCSALIAGGLVGCGGGDEGSNEEANWISPDGDLGGSNSTGAGRTTEIDAPDAPAGPGPRVLFLGDSLSAGLHLPANEAFPAVLRDRLAAQGLHFELVNAGVSGDTTAGGLARLDWLLRQEPDLVVVELGANDGLRGVALDSVEANLRAILERLEAEQVEVLLLGMKLPSNYGEQYASGFEQLFARLAEDTGVAFVPFFLDGVALDPELNLADGLHPNTAGHRILAANLLPALRPLVRALAPEPES